MLDAGERRAVEERLAALDREHGLQIGVAILPSLEGDSLERVSMAIAERWRPGDAEQDDGALVVVAVRERKIRIEVGYGLEPRVTDAAAGRIIRHRMAPEFRRGRYGDGVLAAVDAIAALAAGETRPRERRPLRRQFSELVLVMILAALIIAFVYLQLRGAAFVEIDPQGRRRGRRGGFWSWGGGGGGFGGGGGGFGGGGFGGGGASGGW